MRSPARLDRAERRRNGQRRRQRCHAREGLSPVSADSILALASIFRPRIG
jgi:hypothetical protein